MVRTYERGDVWCCRRRYCKETWPPGRVVGSSNTLYRLQIVWVGEQKREGPLSGGVCKHAIGQCPSISLDVSLHPPSPTKKTRDSPSRPTACRNLLVSEVVVSADEDVVDDGPASATTVMPDSSSGTSAAPRAPPVSFLEREA